MDGNSIVKINFAYTDNLNESTNVTKEFNADIFIDQTPFEFLVEEFKLFMLTCGFSYKLVNKVQIAYEEEGEFNE